MKNFFKGKFLTGIVVVATIVLAGVAIYTAMRLYQLRQESISPSAPESLPLAWDCSKYTFSVSANGVVNVANNSSRDESAQQAKVYINNSLIATLDVPALQKGASATLGTVQVPQGGFKWKVQGTKDCSNTGTAAKACEELKFTITQNTPTLTPTLPPNATSTPTPTVTSTPTPTEPPIGGTSPTPTPEPTATTVASPTPTIKPPSIASPPNCTAAKPDAPVLTSIQRSGTTAILTWNGVSLATHYVISYGTSPDNFQYGVPNTGNVTSYTIEKLDANTKYYFTVYAVNDCMPSEGSNVITSVAGISTATGELPSTGIPIPTILGFAGGVVFILLAIVLAI
jgi:hypothetical protein